MGDYLATLAQAFPLSWSPYVRRLSVKTPEARAFYEAEALRGGWSVRQLDRPISTLCYERLTLPDENPSVGLILCSERDAAVAHYALGNLLNKVMAAEYRLALPDPRRLEEEIEKTRRLLQSPARRTDRADA